jgi:hypothetical protein
MTYATSDITRQAFDKFQTFDADTKLALLWYGYLDIKDQLSPGTQINTEAASVALYDQFKAASQQDQLQGQRDIVNCADTPISQTYSALNSSGKLLIWLLLAQGMENGEIINVPSDYQLPGNTNEFTEQIKQLDFEQRINFMRSAAVAMGANPQR